MRSVPHVIVKAMAGRTEKEKNRLAEAITRNVMDILGSSADAVSVSFVDIASDGWREEVYLPDIKGQWDTLVKKPGYKM